MKPIIKVDNLSKQYRIGALEASYGTLRETIVGLARAPVRRLRNRAENETKHNIWALKDVSFEVNPGEVVGVIGRNGAGKSTLLKVLARITEPTQGKVELYGRVASLLEVGTGFHPELTGRENILLNGAILGMRKVETERKFDEIVAFSEVEKFVDTPVKRYSTGMYLRLAFAVAAHLEPEILIVDEVLAVGDANFQRKCLDKMETVARQGRTVLFVSHNMQAIVRLCPRAILMKDGSVAMDGDSRKIALAVSPRVEKGARLQCGDADRVRPERRDAVGIELQRHHVGDVAQRRLAERVHQRRIDVAALEAYPRLVQRPRAVHLDVRVALRRPGADRIDVLHE